MRHEPSIWVFTLKILISRENQKMSSFALFFFLVLKKTTAPRLTIWGRLVFWIYLSFPLLWFGYLLESPACPLWGILRSLVFVFVAGRYAGTSRSVSCKLPTQWRPLRSGFYSRPAGPDRCWLGLRKKWGNWGPICFVSQ